MSAVAFLPMSSPRQSTPLRHPGYRSPSEKSPSLSFTERFREKLRSDSITKMRSARETSATGARGGEEEMMRIIERGEQRRQQTRMEREASRWTMSQPEESDMDLEHNPDETLLEELLRKEEEDILALLAAKEESEQNSTKMVDVTMSDIEGG